MKFHLPNSIFKSLMAVVCVPGTTIASDLVGDMASQRDTFLYVNAAEVASGDAGVFSLSAQADEEVLRWNSAEDDSAVWDTEQTAVWADDSIGTAETTFTPGSHVVFGEGEELNKTVQIAEDGVAPSVVEISGSGYHFSGGDMVVTDSLIAGESATLDNVLVIGSTTTPLDIYVAEDKTLTASCIETFFTGTHEHHNYAHGSFVKTGGGTLRITQATHGSITAVTLQGGLVELGDGVSLDVGGNEIIGGTLENVQMLVTGDITRTLTGVTVTAHNIVKSADGVHAALLTDVSLHAGTSTEYVTLQNVVFAGQSKLTGYITFEETQAQRELGVATDGTLSVENVTFELRGISSGPKVLIVNGAVDDAGNGLLSGMALPGNVSGLTGTISGWDTVKFVYSGVAVNSAAINSSVAGTVTLLDKHDGNLYWDGSEDDKWNPTSANWSLVAGEQGNEVFTALSNVHFGGGDVSHHDILVTQDTVVMNLSVTEGGYSFSGARVAVLNDASFAPATGKVTFHDQLVVQGNLDTAGAGHVELLDATTVGLDVSIASAHTTLSGDMTVGGTFSVDSGSASTAGSLDISGNVTAQEINIAVSAGRREDLNTYDKALVNVSGNLSVGESGLITIGGTAEQHYRGVVTAGELQVNTQEHEVYFDHLHVDTLTVGAGAYVHVQTASPSITLSSSSFDVINLAGTLALDARATTYDRGYEVRVQGDAAQLRFGSGCTIDNLSVIGRPDDSGYTNLDIVAQSRNATVTHMQDLGNLTVRTGSVTVKDASGAIHGTLTLDNGKLKLGEGADFFMAADSGAIVLKNGARLDIGTTQQTLSVQNTLSLSGASAITGGTADGTGWTMADGASVTYADAGNAIRSQMLVDGTLALHAAKEKSSLDVSGNISGSGVLALSGPGTVALSAANSFNGSVLVGQGGTVLSLQDADALKFAQVEVSSGATLALDAPGAVQLESLTLADGAGLSISSIVGTKDFSAEDAVLHVTPEQITLGDAAVTLNVSFAEELRTMTTYNILTGLSSIDALSLNVQHNGADLHASQYKVGFDAESGLLYLHTLMGNVWEGKGRFGYWVSTGGYGNWNGGQDYDEKAEYKAAIFGDLEPGAHNTIAILDTVNPGDVYFVADSTKYTFYGSGKLAAGTKIHMDGAGEVTLQLYNNMSVDSALGDIDIQKGSLNLEEPFVVGGKVTVSPDAQLVVKGGNNIDNILIELKMGPQADGTFNYTVAGVYDASTGYVDASIRGVTMDAAGIRGTEEKWGVLENALISGKGSLSHLTLVGVEAKGDIEMSNVVLTVLDSELQQRGYYNLSGVTIGENVVVDADGRYSFTGSLELTDTLVNKGVVHLTSMNVEIGQLGYTYSVDADNKVTFEYQFIRHEENGRFDDYSYKGFHAGQVLINGINLGSDPATTGLAADVKADVKYDDGTFTLSVGNVRADGTVDGTVGMPQWDERWGKMDKAPGISRLHFGQDATFVMAGGKDGLTDYYLYSSIVNDANNDKVNNGNGAIVVTLSSKSTGDVASAGTWGATAPDHEVWIYDRSGFQTVIGGQNAWVDKAQSAATHVLVNVDTNLHSVAKNIIGGSYRMDQNAESFVTVENGKINLLIGGSSEWGYTQKGTAHVFVDGGSIGELFAAGYDTNLVGTQVKDGRSLAVELVLSGGTLGAFNESGTKRVFGGGHGYIDNGERHGYVKGDIYIRMDGSAHVATQLVGGSNGGTVNGNIVLDLFSGSANRVDAAGLGWEDEGNATYSETNGDVLVNLYRDFHFGKLVDGTEWVGGELYGGREQKDAYVRIGDGYTSTLHFAEAGKYELGRVDTYASSPDSVTLTGFDRMTMAEGAHVVVALGYFDNDMVQPGTDVNTVSPLEISGKGVVEVIGHGENFGRNILLKDGATLKISTSTIGDVDDVTDDRTITVSAGSTIDFSGFPVDAGYEDTQTFAGLGFNAVICGDGADGKGALYKGKSYDYIYPSDEVSHKNIVNKITLPSVTLTDNASATVEDGEYLFMNNNEFAQTHLDLNEFTFTKQGGGQFITRHAAVTPGTILVHEGALGVDLTTNAQGVDMVLASGTSLLLNSTEAEGATRLEIRSLSGSGHVALNDSPLILQTTTTSSYYDAYMDEKQTYSQFTAGMGGFAYAVFSGLLSDGDKSGGILAKTGNGVHYLSGSESTYTGGTLVQEGRLYLLGSSAAETWSKGESTVATGVVGAGAVMWSKAGAELYLGHNTRIYNNGTTSENGGVMTIGVEAAASGTLSNYVGLHSKGENGQVAYVVMGGEEYVEIDTHNLKSIAVNAKYADGTDYVAGSDINRNLMLLVSKAAWATAQSTTVTGLSDTRYNEAIFSGSLGDNEDMVASLHKVDAGILVMDQTNTYSGGTVISGGTLRLRGWATLGINEKDNAVVQDTAGSTLMFTYNTGYGNEPSELTNDITITGTGHDHWLGHAATDEQSAALISAVGPAVRFTLSGDIKGDGNVLHAGEGVLELSGDSSYTGGTYVSRGVVEVQSATGLGSTDDGKGSVTVEADADLRFTVESGYTAPTMVTKLAADKNVIEGDVLIAGTETTERILHMDGNGYNATSTTLQQNGTFLLNGEAIDGQAVSAHSGKLTGDGAVVVSDASGSGASATFDTMIDYTGDFRVEGDRASIKVSTGSYTDGSISVAGNQASAQFGGDITIVDGESLRLSSTGDAPGSSAAVITGGSVSVTAGAVFSVSNQETAYEYNLSKLQENVSLAVTEAVQIQAQNTRSDLSYTEMGNCHMLYDGAFDASLAVNNKVVGTVQAGGGLTLDGGATYETIGGHTSLLGGSLTLDTLANSLLTFHTTPDTVFTTINGDTQLVLFSEVGSVFFGLDGVQAKADSGIYYTRADRYLTGCDYIDGHTLLVYDSHAAVVYLHTETIPEPATTTLSLLALASLVARRRRK